MRSTKQLSITLPTEMAEMIRNKVEAGEYASESEVIRNGLRVLLARDRALEQWLREEVAPAYDAMMSPTAKRLTSHQMRASLKEQHEAQLKKLVKKKRS